MSVKENVEGVDRVDSLVSYVDIDIGFYTDRLNYYRHLIGGMGITNFVLAEGYKVRGYGQIEYYLESRGLAETVEFWENGLEWYKKNEFEKYVKSYCNCELGRGNVCTGCGKKRVVRVFKPRYVGQSEDRY